MLAHSELRQSNDLAWMSSSWATILGLSWPAEFDGFLSSILALLLDPDSSTALERRSLSVDGDSAAVLKQALYDSKGTSPRSTRPLPSSRRRRSAPSQTRTSSNLDRRAFSDGHHGTKRLPLRGDVPSAGGVSKCAAALSPSSPASFSRP